MAQALKCVPLKPEGLSVRLSSADYSCSVLTERWEQNQGKSRILGCSREQQKRECFSKKGKARSWYSLWRPG